MNEPSSQAILLAAVRANWQIRDKRALQIAAAAVPRLADFQRVRGSLTIDDDVNLGVVLRELCQRKVTPGAGGNLP